nr:centrosomal protein of 162 kDa [Onthophagus taurus]
MTSSFWWMKKSKTDSNIVDISKPPVEEDISSSLAEFLQKEVITEDLPVGDKGELDIPSIIEEINRIAAQSPLGPYEDGSGDRSVEDLMREAEKIYMESSKSFEQLSQHSATSHNVTDHLNSNTVSPMSENTPKSLGKEDEEYSDDFNKSESERSSKSKVDEISLESFGTPIEENRVINDNVSKNLQKDEVIIEINDKMNQEEFNLNLVDSAVHLSEKQLSLQSEIETKNKEIIFFKDEAIKKDHVIEHLIEENKIIKSDLRELQSQLQETINLLEQAKNALKSQSLKSPEVNLELEKALEDVKDTKEINTALQLQLDSVNQSHQFLKIAYDELQVSNKSLERKIVDVDITLAKYKGELLNLQHQNEKYQENELGLNKLLEIEKLEVKSLKLQTEKDARCIMDLNRQIKEMERIITRKHPDSVSALIVAAKNDVSENNVSTKKFLEDRIKSLETEAQKRDVQNSKVFLDVQEKFNQMKIKYESHIEDLELHVNDLKDQLKRREDNFDVYTQTVPFESPRKDTVSVSVQTETLKIKNPPNITKRSDKLDVHVKEDAHLLATIRGLQTDLSNKEKALMKSQRDLEEVKKTNRRLQKEREGSLRNLSERKEFRSYPEKLTNQLSKNNEEKHCDDEVRALRTERDKMKSQLCRIEDDFQVLKNKRIQDLNTLQEAHEKEISTYLANITPLREQLEIQQVSLSSLQKQLMGTKEELAIVTVERDHLNNRLQPVLPSFDSSDSSEVEALKKKVAFLERRYEEREHRLRAIVHGLAQKNVSNKSCDQCAIRQQQLIGYKVELDQLIATLKCLQ